MAKLLYGSINFDELLAQIRTGTINTEIVTRKNGETFRSVSLNIWVNDQEDQYGNIASVQLQLKKRKPRQRREITIHRKSKAAHSKSTGRNRQ